MDNIKPVRISKRGSNYQIYYYNPNRERRRLSVGNNIQNAHHMAVQFNDWLLEGKDPEYEIKQAEQIEKARKITLKELFPIFIERHGSKQSNSMQKMYQERFKNISRCPQLCEIQITNISKRLMLDYMHTRMKQDNVSVATVNREAALVKSVLFRATEWDILEHNPLQGLRLFPEAEKRKVEISTEDAANLLSELPEPMANIMEFAIYSGFRKENILGLKIEFIQFHDLTPTGEVDLVIKGGRTEKFPLCLLAVEVLKRVIRERKRGYVFLNPHTNTRYYSILKTFDRAVRKVGLTVNGTKLRFHDLRHIFASWLLRTGVSLDAVRELMGHKDRSTTDRYATLNRMEASQHLKSMPRITKNAEKKAPTKNKPEYSDTNRHKIENERLLFVSEKVISS